MSQWHEILMVLLAYLAGSIPFGYIFTRRYTGKNILELGSGNTGSTNVRRIAGKQIALLTQICDMLKGLLPVSVVFFLMDNHPCCSEKYFIYLVALATIIGHDFSVFLRFKGGKGVNTTLGASLLIAPYSVLISVIIYYVIKWRSKFVSPGSIALAISLPLSDLIIHGTSFQFYYLLLASCLIIFMHIPNIRRIISGNENS
jgi:glycerol-3-phosphate acyltransferase PlsY